MYKYIILDIKGSVKTIHKNMMSSGNSSLLCTPQPESGCAVKSNGIRPIGSSPLAKGRMLGKPYSLALTRQRVSGQGVKSN